jgi:hypothetical protein
MLLDFHHQMNFGGLSFDAGQPVADAEIPAASLLDFQHQMNFGGLSLMPDNLSQMLKFQQQVCWISSIK